MVSRVKILHQMIDKMHVQLIPLDLLMKENNNRAKQDRKVLIRALHRAPTKTNRNIAKRLAVGAKFAMVMMLQTHLNMALQQKLRINLPPLAQSYLGFPK